MNIACDYSQLVGGTPLIKLSRLSRLMGLDTPIIAKVEGMNPSGSVKDRAALSMINAAEANGTLKAGGTVIEPTSGNTGIGLAAICAVRGYNLILTMPDTMSLERRQLLAAYGAKLVLTDGSKGMAGAVEEAQKLHAITDGSIIAGQFVNPANPAAHKATADEIWQDTDGKIDAVVVGVGTGGTVTGLSRYLREYKRGVEVIAVEPHSSNVLSGGCAGKHKLQGIGAGFVPEVLDCKAYDSIIAVKDEDAYACTAMLAKSEGLLAGISSGAVIWAAKQYLGRAENKGKLTVAILPDCGNRYLSTGVFG
ncbi:MAG: cysteine synthase A [Clostridia bacterium]|nr:cysteine synthase A [Clostridia bacterium]